MRISIDTDVDTFNSAIKAVHAAYRVDYDPTRPLDEVEEHPGEANVHDDEDDDFLPGRWTPERLDTLVDWLADSDAAAALRYIAEHAPAVDLEEVFTFMGEHTGIEDFNGKHMGGRMSAVGFGIKSIGRGLGPVYDTDYARRKYRMDRRIAEALLKAFNAAEA